MPKLPKDWIRNLREEQLREYRKREKQRRVKERRNTDENNILSPEVQAWPIRSEDYTLLQKLRENGGTSAIYAAQCLPLNKLCSFKKIRLNEQTDGSYEQSVNARLVSTCSHPNILSCYCTFQAEGFDYIVARLPYRGTLHGILGNKKRDKGSSRGVLRAAHVAYVTREVLYGLEYLHTRGWIHGDIRSSNILVDSEGHVVIGDFETATRYYNPDIATSEEANEFMRYPPEVLALMEHEFRKTNKGRSFASDVWNVGLFMIEMVTGWAPYGNVTCYSEAIKQIIKSRSPNLHSFSDTSSQYRKYGRDIRHMISVCLIKSPLARPSCSKLIKHPFLEKHRAVTNQEFREVVGKFANVLKINKIDPAPAAVPRVVAVQHEQAAVQAVFKQYATTGIETDPFVSKSVQVQEDQVSPSRSRSSSKNFEVPTKRRSLSLEKCPDLSIALAKIGSARTQRIPELKSVSKIMEKKESTADESSNQTSAFSFPQGEEADELEDDLEFQRIIDLSEVDATDSTIPMMVKTKRSASWGSKAMLSKSSFMDQYLPVTRVPKVTPTASLPAFRQMRQGGISSFSALYPKSAKRTQHSLLSLSRCPSLVGLHLMYTYRNPEQKGIFEDCHLLFNPIKDQPHEIANYLIHEEVLSEIEAVTMVDFLTYVSTRFKAKKLIKFGIVVWPPDTVIGEKFNYYINIACSKQVLEGAIDEMWVSLYEHDKNPLEITEYIAQALSNHSFIEEEDVTLVGYKLRELLSDYYLHKKGISFSLLSNSDNLKIFIAD